MATTSKSLKSPSEISLKAQALLDSKLTINATPTLYIAGYRSKTGKHIALQRCRDSVFVWTEAVYEIAPVEFQKHLVRQYAKDKSRSSNLNAKNASRLMVGYPANYWEFPGMSGLESFVDWYNTL